MTDDNVRQREVPTFGRGTCLYRGIVTGFGHDNDFTVYAYCGEDGFELSTHDDGHWPVDELHWALWVEPEHLADLILALGGQSGDDPVKLLARQMQNGVINHSEIGTWISEHGVPYTHAGKSVSNL